MTRKTWLLGIALVPALCGDELRVGRAAVKITPPAGTPMAGYYSIRLAEGTHDELWAKALVVENDGKKAALVACDLAGVDRPIVEAARVLIEKTTGLRGEQVMVSATHSHTGPLLRERFLSFVDGRPLQIARQYLQALPGKIAESVRLAEAGLAPARIWAGIGKEESLSFNRRYLMKDGTVRTNPGKLNPDIVQPVGPIDPELAVVYFEAPDGKPQATLVNFALHPDTVGGRRFSADYPHMIATLLEKVKEPEMLTVFTIGAAGNVNHVDVKSRAAQSGYDEARRIGTVLAGEVIKTYGRLEPLAAPFIRVRSEVIKLPLSAFEPGAVEKARATAAKFGKPAGPPFLDMAKAFKVLDVADRDGRPLEAEVQVIAIGGQLALVGLPGEIFVELGIAIKRASPFPYTIVTGLANGAIGYVPNRKAYVEGGYEVISARCAAGCGELLADAAIRLLAALHRAGRG